MLSHAELDRIARDNPREGSAIWILVLIGLIGELIVLGCAMFNCVQSW